jgi:hypothetical protein
MTTITLPPLPSIYENHAGKWIDGDDVRARDLEVARVVLEGAAKQVRDSGVCPFAVADGIAATEVKHHE